ncbi:uncharacterized protein METZ01_LOCUS416220, partial [marine metagenome]
AGHYNGRCKPPVLFSRCSAGKVCIMRESIDNGIVDLHEGLLFYGRAIFERPFRTVVVDSILADQTDR